MQSDPVNLISILKHAKRWHGDREVVTNAVEGASLSAAEVIDHLAKTFAKWQLPNAILFVDEIPLTATEKIDRNHYGTTTKKYLFGN